MLVPITDVLLLLQRGYVDVGFMGGAQIDRYGNLNSSFIGDPDAPRTRLPGTGGGNDIASFAQMIVAMKHEKRRFVEAQSLLIHTDRTISEIASSLGYDAQSHFNQQFSRHVGMPPGEFRKHYVVGGKKP